MSHLHQRHTLFGPYTLLVYEYQNANNGTNKADTSHEARCNNGGIGRYCHQLIAAFSMVVEVFTHRTSKKKSIHNIKLWLERKGHPE